ncbi:MAG: AIR synthase-related protein, partial [Cyanobium sp.]
WDAATSAEPERLRRQLALLPQLAGEGLAHGAKDISMGGLAGTAVMFAEAAGCTLRLDLEAIAPPAGVELEAWLTCFPSFGYLLAVRPERLAALQRLCAPWPELLCARIGGFHAGPPALELQHGGEVGALWQEHEPLTGFAALPA